MVTCCIQYTLDPHQIDDFEAYATAWTPIIERCGGALIGYWLPKEGANDYALALIDFPSLADYERYRENLAVDPDAVANRAMAQRTRCIRVESRSFLRNVTVAAAQPTSPERVVDGAVGGVS
jgi:hypothetical protein